jgi:dipeptidase
VVKKIFFCLLILEVAVVSTHAGDCFTIVVGKAASADGSVIMAHNEDDGAPAIVRHLKVPRKQHPPGEKVKLIGGGEVDQVPETWAYFWSQMPGLLFSDSFVNEWGVCIASDNCPSREDKPQISDGGISLMLRRLVAERAKTAREGVRLAGELVDRFGYNASGRTYIVSDPEEGWFFCAVHGKHWLAARVPDDQVAMVANTYTIHGVDLKDLDHFLASKDLVEYAKNRGWYDPKKDGAFDFAAIYADPVSASDSSNFCRQWAGYRFVVSDPLPLSPILPFSVVPKSEIGVKEVMEILRDHYEWTGLHQADPRSGSPHGVGINTICNETTQTSFIVQLRGYLPSDVGIVYWVSLSHPGESVYIPFYFGMDDFPAGYAGPEEVPTLEVFRNQIASVFLPDPREAFRTFSNFTWKINGEYGRLSQAARDALSGVEERALTLQIPLEEELVQLYATDRPAAKLLMSNFSAGVYLDALQTMDRVLQTGF